MSDLKATVGAVKTPVGWIELTVKNEKLANVRLLGSKRPKETNLSRGVLMNAAIQLEEYFKGERREFSIPLDLPEKEGFTPSVWHELARIPYGEVRSYGEIAHRLKKPKASRAVGQACGRNPFLIFIPCHRVLAANGKLGGFALDLKIKEHLLRLEGRMS